MTCQQARARDVNGMDSVRELFREQGYVLFEEALSPEELATLRHVCDELMDEPSEDGGGNTHRIGLGEKRRFLRHRHADYPDLEDFVTGQTIGRITNACDIKNAMLFNEQFVVKGALEGASFAWHQDGAYVGFDHTAYLTIWIALDDATVDNGCIYIQPRNIDLLPRIDPHEWQDATNELTCYFGKDPGVPIECTAGTIVAFSSLTLHRSGENITPFPRRAYVTQYSSGPINDPDTGRPKRFAKPVKV